MVEKKGVEREKEGCGREKVGRKGARRFRERGGGG